MKINVYDFYYFEFLRIGCSFSLSAQYDFPLCRTTTLCLILFSKRGDLKNPLGKKLMQKKRAASQRHLSAVTFYIANWKAHFNESPGQTLCACAYGKWVTATRKYFYAARNNFSLISFVRSFLCFLSCRFVQYFGSQVLTAHSFLIARTSLFKQSLCTTGFSFS